ncbi:Hypothetical Protein FCC1311_074152 [Hondaea fermentalgiana]|uniref:O-fucosyltransferase family protein n=1 Tax=Hondaea fermentalgiana TaxID=2315210 RepID=A0A2R5GTI0_9STRA|nr:Hypothetical Protein FCC1311_074152 [Hondaea fermentalgiana]|eukprot:GBG31194.1 Hypothetical Protein FCC1311_074152 [Hondaea fermentalgiana]
MRRCLLSAIGICRDYGLTLLIPPAARHSNFENGYLDQTVETTIPMDQILDIEYMERAFGIEINPINGTLYQFWKETLGGTEKTNSLVTYPKWQGKMMMASGKTIQNVRRQIQNAKTPIIFAKGRWYSRKYYPTWYNAYTRHSPYFLKISHMVMKAMGTDFDSFHIRLGDYEERALKRNANCGNMIKTALESGMSQDRPVYVATDGMMRDNMGKLTPYFQPMSAFKRVVSQVDLAEIPEVAEALIDFKHRLPTTKIYMDTFGMVEQLIAARGRTFMGTSVSTFSRTISHMRHYMLTTIPDMADPANKVPWKVGSSYLSGWSGRLAGRGRSQNLAKPIEDLQFGPKAPNTEPDRNIAVRAHNKKGKKGGKNNNDDDSD